MYPMQIPSHAPGTQLLSQGMLPAAGQLSQLPVQQGVVGQSGGILSKLIGGAKAGGGGITNIMNMLQNAQKAIGTIQSIGPMVQQYGPLVKSLPALIGAMRGSGNSDNESTGTSNNNNVAKKYNTPKVIPQKAVAKTPSKKNNTAKKNYHKTKHKKSRKNSTTEISKEIPAPKLYI